MNDRQSDARTWTLLSGLVVVGLATVWLSNRVLPPALMARLAEAETGLAMGSSQIEAIERRQWLGYLATPVFLVGKVLLVALVIQAVGMALSGALPIRVAVRAAVMGGFAAAYSTLMTLAWIWRLGPASLTIDELGVAPATLAAILFSPDQSREFLYRAAAEVGVGGGLWIALVALALSGKGDLTGRRATLVAAGAFLILAVARVGAQVLTNGLLAG